MIAVAAEARTPVYQDAPTFAEQGVPGVVGHGWFGIVAPARTPAAIVQQVNRDATQALGDPEVTKRLLALGLQPAPGTSADFAGFIDSEVAKWGALVKARGIVLGKAPCLGLRGACVHPSRGQPAEDGPATDHRRALPEREGQRRLQQHRSQRRREHPE